MRFEFCSKSKEKNVKGKQNLSTTLYSSKNLSFSSKIREKRFHTSKILAEKNKEKQIK